MIADQAISNYHDAAIEHGAPGWFNHGAELLRLVEVHRPIVCVELGTWLGASAIPIARAIRRWGGTVTCVDTWTGEISYATTRPPWMLLSCARNLIEAGVSATVRLIPSPTTAAAAAWREPIDWLYIDAAHDEASVWADLRAWIPHVKPGGIVLGDDYDNAHFPGVKRAWDAYELARGWTLTRYQSDPPDPYGNCLIYGVVPYEDA